jgi:hypothetical protein
MKALLSILVLLTGLNLVSCTKTSGDPITGLLPVTLAVQTGDWMVSTYTENGANKSPDFGLTFLKFSANGGLVATKDGAVYSGTWTEVNAGGINTLAINIGTPDVMLKKANGTWKVTSVTEFYIDLKDGSSAATSSTINLMKH